jgi:hypothetical protein
MPWFAAHIIMQVKFKDADQQYFPVWENIVLIEAVDDESAMDVAEKIGHSSEGDSEGSFKWNDKNAEWKYMGIRKLIEVRNANSDNYSITDGTEITFNTLEFSDKDSLEKFLDGEPVIVNYIE